MGGIATLFCTILTALTFKKGYETVGQSAAFKAAEKRILLYTASNCLVTMLMFGLQSWRLFAQLMILITGDTSNQSTMLSWFFSHVGCPFSSSSTLLISIC
ncbi:hypothetical protein Y032_0134g1807 [Ancylostoma ceylanicum]|uniref:Uncharacterized protein n=1 Tax=Ancylostoma ceylanicum TaxID=53326 RepID=A0A016T5P0_9BILA|nr:hypothetical protein Y032_0134g1807 [Ancylostoma ceylanicum]